jgi:hypothetical protein
MAQTEPNERKWVFLLCLLAAIHVFIFSAAFPFFNNTDEGEHFDLVLKYSRGNVPRGMEVSSDECVRYFAVYSASFYLGSAADAGEFLPPPWEWPSQQKNTIIQSARKSTQGIINQESSQPPLYYALAGSWWRLGGALGLDGGQLLYWLRFLNVPIVVILVWLGWLAARLVFPADKFPRLGVPALLAFFPQSAFYSIQNDVLSPICFGAAFICLIRLMKEEIPTIRLGIATGLALAATFLVKPSNLPLLGVSVAVLFFLALKLWHSGKLPVALPAFSWLAACATLPAVLWMFWCQKYFGSLTGSKPKVLALGWTLKPFDEWWHHPIFTLDGFWSFLSPLLACFWQGEMSHHHQPLALPAFNLFYAVVTLILLAAALAGLVASGQATSAPQRRALGFSFFACVAAVAFLGFLSIIYDFHDCLYPSRELPFFTSGRLLLGALIPFSLLFVYGLDRALGWFKFDIQSKFRVLGALLFFMLMAEIITNWPAFADEYNWFHM